MAGKRKKSLGTMIDELGLSTELVRIHQAIEKELKPLIKDEMIGDIVQAKGKLFGATIQWADSPDHIDPDKLKEKFTRKDLIKWGILTPGKHKTVKKLHTYRLAGKNPRKGQLKVP